MSWTQTEGIYQKGFLFDTGMYGSLLEGSWFHRSPFRSPLLWKCWVVNLNISAEAFCHWGAVVCSISINQRFNEWSNDINCVIIFSLNHSNDSCSSKLLSSFASATRFTKLDIQCITNLHLINISEKRYAAFTNSSSQPLSFEQYFGYMSNSRSFAYPLSVWTSNILLMTVIFWLSTCTWDDFRILSRIQLVSAYQSLETLTILGK